MEIKCTGLSIFQKLLIAIVIVTILPLGTSWFISRYNLKNTWETHIGDKLFEKASSLSGEVDGWFDMNLRLLAQNAKTDSIRSMEKSQHDTLLRTIKSSYDWVNLAFTLDTNGRNIGRSDNKPPNPTDRRLFYRTILNGAPHGFQVVIGITSGKPALILGTPIKSDGDNLQGVIALGMTLEKLSNTIVTEKLGETGFAFLLDGEGKPIAHPQIDLSKENKDFSDHPLYLRSRNTDVRSFVYTEDGRDIIGSAQKTAQGWTLVVQQDYDEAFAPVYESDRNTLLMLIAAVVLAVFVAFIVSRWFTKPIVNLTDITDGMSRGKLDTTIEETQRCDEIGALAQAIERMGESIRLAMERLRKKD